MPEDVIEHGGGRSRSDPRGFSGFEFAEDAGGVADARRLSSRRRRTPPGSGSTLEEDRHQAEGAQGQTQTPHRHEGTVEAWAPTATIQSAHFRGRLRKEQGRARVETSLQDREGLRRNRLAESGGDGGEEWLTSRIQTLVQFRRGFPVR